MALAPATRLGPYEILSPLGAGGMGEVYLNTGYVQNFGLAPDGKRFAVLMSAAGPKPGETHREVRLVLNFFDEVRRRVAAGQ